MVHALTQELDVPVAVKLTPYFSSFGEACIATGRDRRRRAGPVQPVPPTPHRRATLTVAPVIGLSHSADARLPQTWIALLRQQITVSLAGTGGVEGRNDLVAYLLAGADVVECASAFLRNGIQYATTLLDGLDAWGNGHGFATVAEARGRLAVPWQVDPEEYTREGYVAALQPARRSYRHH